MAPNREFGKKRQFSLIPLVGFAAGKPINDYSRLLNIDWICHVIGDRRSLMK